MIVAADHHKASKKELILLPSPTSSAIVNATADVISVNPAIPKATDAAFSLKNLRPCSLEAAPIPITRLSVPIMRSARAPRRMPRNPRAGKRARNCEITMSKLAHWVRTYVVRLYVTEISTT